MKEWLKRINEDNKTETFLIQQVVFCSDRHILPPVQIL